MKITAIHSGGDWYDASAEYLVLPENMDIEKEARARQKWYKEKYCVGKLNTTDYRTLAEWLIERGARYPTEEELIIFDEL